MDLQEILTYLIIAAAVYALVARFALKRDKKTCCGKSNCPASHK